MAFRALFICLISLLMALISCSDKGDIPYIEENQDSLQPVYYHDASGTYLGELTTYYADGSMKNEVNHELTISEITFDSVRISGISTILTWDINAYLYRVPDGIYLAFQEMVNEDEVIRGVPLSGRPDYNGIYAITTKYLEYSIEVISGADTTIQYYFGKNNSNE